MSRARERLLKVAGRLFAERGYACVGINEIIATADTAKATFYQHFPSKEALCLAWLEAESERRDEARRRTLADPVPVPDRVAAWFDALRDEVGTRGDAGCPFAMTAAMTGPGGALRGAVARERKAERAFWRELAGRQESSKKAAKDLGDAWCLLASAAVVEARTTGSAWPVKKAKRAALALIGAV